MEPEQLLFPTQHSDGDSRGYLCLELLIFLGGEGGAAVRWHFHLRYDPPDLVPHAVTLLRGEKVL